MNRSISVIVLVAIVYSVMIAGATYAQEKAANIVPAPAINSFQAKDYSSLLGMEGFSETLLNNHVNLYRGYVKAASGILGKLDEMLSENKDRTAEYAELERRLSWEYNGMLLHEYYFENLGGKGTLDPKSDFYKKIVEEFGSFERWKQDFVSTGMMRGIGWVVLYLEPRTGRFLNIWVDEHNTGNIVGAKPIVVMDVFEHAYMIDFQLDKAKYIETFFININWDVAAQRFGK